MGFGKSFDEAFKPAFAQSQAGALDALKEKIKNDAEKVKQQSKLLNIQSSVVSMQERMKKSGQDTTSIDPFVEGIAQVKDADVAELFLKSALSTAEKQKSLTDQILELSKVAEAGKTIGNRGLFDTAVSGANTLLGGTPPTETPSQPTTQPQAPQAEPTSQPSSILSISNIIAPEIDNFTGKPTSKGLQQEAQNKSIIAQVEREIKGESGDVAGRISLAEEAIKNISDVKSILFPSGKADSFRKDIAFGGNVPLGQAPFIGALIPDKIPFGKQGQEFHRKMGAALSARILIKTGVAARPEEVRAEFSQFAPEWSSNPEAALNGLNELDSFYKNFLTTVRPTKGSKGTQTFTVDGVTYNIPSEKVDAFKKAKGLS